MNLNRRKLISWFGLGWLASLLPSSLVGTPNAAANPSGDFKAIGTVADLGNYGSLLSGDEMVSVVLDPQDPTRVLAVNPTCTHNGCKVQWQNSSEEYVCPCHGARFSANGAVNSGPAGNALPRYSAKIASGQVLVSW